MMPSKLWLPKKPLGSLGSPKKTLNKEPDEPQTILSNGKQLKNSSNNCRKFNKEKYFLETPGPGYSGHSKDLQNSNKLKCRKNYQVIADVVEMRLKYFFPTVKSKK